MADNKTTIKKAPLKDFDLSDEQVDTALAQGIAELNAQGEIDPSELASELGFELETSPKSTGSVSCRECGIVMSLEHIDFSVSPPQALYVCSLCDGEKRVDHE